MQGTIASAGRLGCILHIDVQSADGIVHTVAGTVLKAEISWAAFEGGALDNTLDAMSVRTTQFCSQQIIV